MPKEKAETRMDPLKAKELLNKFQNRVKTELKEFRKRTSSGDEPQGGAI
jgi:hypothetical protein